MESRTLSSSFLILLIFILFSVVVVDAAAPKSSRQLRFGGKKTGEFKILQVSDMHYSDGKSAECVDVFPEQLPTCSDLNTTAFLYRLIHAENPDLVVFTGDNIDASISDDVAKSLDLAFAPVVKLKVPWAAILGICDKGETMSRDGVMQHIIQMPHTLSRLNPAEEPEINGFGNYNLEVGGDESSPLANKSVLNLYLLDSGDYAGYVSGHDWIKPSQQLWFQHTSSRLKNEYMGDPAAQKDPAPGLVYFHTPLTEYNNFDSSNITGVKQEEVGSADYNSGLFSTMLSTKDVKAAFAGEDHLNDFCGKLKGIHLCYGGGFGYHAAGKAGWPRRARVVSASLEMTVDGTWGGVETIKTWKRLDDRNLSTIDTQILWSKLLNK